MRPYGYRYGCSSDESGGWHGDSAAFRGANDIPDHRPEDLRVAQLSSPAFVSREGRLFYPTMNSAPSQSVNSSAKLSALERWPEPVPQGSAQILEYESVTKGNGRGVGVGQVLSGDNRIAFVGYGGHIILRLDNDVLVYLNGAPGKSMAVGELASTAKKVGAKTVAFEWGLSADGPTLMKLPTVDR